MRQLVWFRTDLRVTDHHALTAAMAKGPTVALYVITPKQWQHHQDAACKIDFWHRNLAALRQQLAELNVPLRLLVVDEWADVAAAIATLCQSLVITQLHLNQEYGVNEQRRDEQVMAMLADVGVVSQTYMDKLLLAPGSILNQSGACFKVFTAFKKVALPQLSQGLPTVQPAPQPQAPINVGSDPWPDGFAGGVATSEQQALWPAGEAAAQARLNGFADGAIHAYQEARDLPSVPGTSQLSPYLAAGVLSVRQCLLRAVAENQGALASGSMGVQTWVNELLWRDFYHHILVAYPHVSMGQPFKPVTQYLVWRDAPEDLARWQQGETGIPLIDAAMKQLLHTGWMHNRLRMVCAMFLSKNLLIDWRLGEAWFMRHLMDGDLAANNGGWQWSASTGTDAVPYFRIFNPITQSQRFDPKGVFIKHWLPQLAGLDHKCIHSGKGANDLFGPGYPDIMVDMKASRERALQAFKALPSVADYGSE